LSPLVGRQRLVCLGHGTNLVFPAQHICVVLWQRQGGAAVGGRRGLNPQSGGIPGPSAPEAPPANQTEAPAPPTLPPARPPPGLPPGRGAPGASSLLSRKLRWGQATELMCAPSPLPSPPEGESVGERGPFWLWGSGAQSASKCRGVLSPRRRSGERVRSRNQGCNPPAEAQSHGDIGPLGVLGRRFWLNDHEHAQP
jgi:hypothetical protein